MNNPVEREEAVFEAAVQLNGSERAAYLDQTCAGQPELRRRIDALLGALERAGGLLKEPVVGRQSGGQSARQSGDEPASPKTILQPAAPAEEGPGTLIGCYKLLEKIGEGGFGVVYMADQREPVKRRVALKIIKLGMDTKQVVARFESERQALALMDHPNIAKVLDAGATDAGRPFFVMELVRGVKLTHYCDQNHLATADRLQLFIQVCQAIQHAHQKGIIHRDIKPSNILVTLHDGVPVPKVIDFGIAKATQGDLTDKTVFTRFQQFIGTPAYMSPEQAEMSGLDIDTRADIYSLGVLLYELLTGRTPFDQQELLAAGVDGMRRMIREQEPVRPSTRVSSLQGQDRTTTAKRHGADAPRLVHLLRGDLDWIVMKCLEKDRTRRYETANGLASDVQRHLHHEPIVARPPSKLYQFRKSVQRNKLLYGAAGAIAIALVLGAAVSTTQAVRANRGRAAAARQRDNARRARQQAEAINKFLTEDLLYQATPDKNARENHVTMEEVLDRAAKKLDNSADIARQPELDATLRLAVGSTYYRLSLLSEAEHHLRRAFTLRRSTLGATNLDTLTAEQELADFLVSAMRKFDEGERLSFETWQGRSQLLGAEHRLTLRSMEFYEGSLVFQGKFEEAERLARKRLEICERVFGPNDPDTIDEIGNLALVLQTRGQYAQSERYNRESLRRYKEAGLQDKLEAFWPANNLAMDRLLQGYPEEAEKLVVEARSRAVRIFGPEHYLTLHLQRVLARTLAEEGRLAEAEILAQETLTARLRKTTDQEGTARTKLILGRVLVETGKVDEAQPLLGEALALFREHCPKKPELAAQAANWLGATYLAHQAYSDAEPLLLSYPEVLLLPQAQLTANELRAQIGHLVKFYQATGKPEQATAWQKKLDQSINHQL